MEDRHHILFCRREWEAREEYMTLRRDSGLIVVMDRAVHEDLHKHCSFVPTLGSIATSHVLRELNRQNYVPTGNWHRNMDSVLLAIDRAAAHKRTRDIEQKICHLAMEAIEEQREYIKEGATGLWLGNRS